MDKPEMGRDVTVGFSCLDSKSSRDDHKSKQTLKKAIEEALEETNWRLVSNDIYYRLGYLSGRLRAYESDDDIKKLVMKSKNFKNKQTSSKADDKKNKHRIKDKDGRDIIL